MFYEEKKNLWNFKQLIFKQKYVNFLNNVYKFIEIKKEVLKISHKLGK